MFKLKQSASFFWPVSVNVPGDGGKFEKQTFDVEFKRATQAKLQDIQTQAEAGTVKDRDIAREVVVGWRGVTDDGAEVPFSAGTFDALLDVPTVAGAIVIAYAEAHAGLVRKN